MSHVPVALKGKEFEQHLLDAALREQVAGRLTMSRYGTNAVTIKDDTDPAGKRTKTLLVPSLPDFEGVRWDARQFQIEAKVCSETSFEMRKATIKPKQVSHMLARAKFGVPCFLVIHFNRRVFKNATLPAITVAIPVHPSNPAWQRYVDAYALAKRLKQPVQPQGSISRDLAQTWGKLVPWRIPQGCTKAYPDLLSFLAPEIPQETQPDLWD